MRFVIILSRIPLRQFTHNLCVREEADVPTPTDSFSLQTFLCADSIKLNFHSQLKFILSTKSKRNSYSARFIIAVVRRSFGTHL